MELTKNLPGLAAVACLLLFGSLCWKALQYISDRRMKAKFIHQLLAFKEILNFLEDPQHHEIPYKALDKAGLAYVFAGTYTGPIKRVRWFGRGITPESMYPFLDGARDHLIKKPSGKLTDRAKQTIAEEREKIEHWLQKHRSANVDVDVETAEMEISRIATSVLQNIFLADHKEI